MSTMAIDQQQYRLTREIEWSGPDPVIVSYLDDRASHIIEDYGPADGDLSELVFKDAVAVFNAEVITLDDIPFDAGVKY